MLTNLLCLISKQIALHSRWSQTGCGLWSSEGKSSVQCTSSPHIPMHFYSLYHNIKYVHTQYSKSLPPLCASAVSCVCVKYLCQHFYFTLHQRRKAILRCVGVEFRFRTSVFKKIQLCPCTQQLCFLLHRQHRSCWHLLHNNTSAGFIVSPQRKHQ